MTFKPLRTLSVPPSTGSEVDENGAYHGGDWKFIVQPTERTLSPGAHGQDDGLGLDGHAAESIIITDPHVAPNLHGAETGDLDRGVTDGRSTLDDQIVRRIVTDVVQPGTDVQLQPLCARP